jgi:hypothetical protein
MNIDQKQVSEFLNQLPYPISKTQLVQQAQNPQIKGVLQRLPDKTFTSAQDLEKELKNAGVKIS